MQRLAIDSRFMSINKTDNRT